MPTDIRYDPAGKRNSVTNRHDPKLATEAVRLASMVGDCTVTISGTTLTIQFYDMKGRPYKGFVRFLLEQHATVLGSAPVTNTSGVLPAASSAQTKGITLLALSANDAVFCLTDANGLFVGTLGGAVSSNNVITATPFTSIYSSVAQ
jgi:hypothetical protein